MLWVVITDTRFIWSLCTFFSNMQFIHTRTWNGAQWTTVIAYVYAATSIGVYVLPTDHHGIELAQRQIMRLTKELFSYTWRRKLSLKLLPYFLFGGNISGILSSLAFIKFTVNSIFFGPIIFQSFFFDRLA